MKQVFETFLSNSSRKKRVHISRKKCSLLPPYTWCGSNCSSQKHTHTRTDIICVCETRYAVAAITKEILLYISVCWFATFTFLMACLITRRNDGLSTPLIVYLILAFTRSRFRVLSGEPGRRVWSLIQRSRVYSGLLSRRLHNCRLKKLASYCLEIYIIMHDNINLKSYKTEGWCCSVW